MCVYDAVGMALRLFQCVTDIRIATYSANHHKVDKQIMFQNTRILYLCTVSKNARM